MEEEIAEIVREHGWYGCSVFDHQPPFLYTIGLMQTCDHPEFIVFGLEPHDAAALLSELVRYIRAGMSFAQPGIYNLEIGDEHRVGIRAVHQTQHQLYLGYAMGYCRHLGRAGELQTFQVFWPDTAGKFPFEVGCDLRVFRLQPRLDVALTPAQIRRLERAFE